MEVRPLVSLDLVAQLASGAVMIVWAWLRPGIWALIAGSLLPPIIRAGWSHLMAGARRDRIDWDGEAARELLVFGRWIWISSLLTFLASQIDRLILGRVFTLSVLGVYSVATVMAEVPRSLVMAINSNVMYPAYAKSLHLPRTELRAKILGYRWRLLALIACGVVALTAGGDLAVYVLYD